MSSGGGKDVCSDSMSESGSLKESRNSSRSSQRRGEALAADLDRDLERRRLEDLLLLRPPSCAAFQDCISHGIIWFQNCGVIHGGGSTCFEAEDEDLDPRPWVRCSTSSTDDPLVFEPWRLRRRDDGEREARLLGSVGERRLTDLERRSDDVDAAGVGVVCLLGGDLCPPAGVVAAPDLTVFSTVFDVPGASVAAFLAFFAGGSTVERESLEGPASVGLWPVDISLEAVMFDDRFSFDPVFSFSFSHREALSLRERSCRALGVNKAQAWQSSVSCPSPKHIKHLP